MCSSSQSESLCFGFVILLLCSTNVQNKQHSGHQQWNQVFYFVFFVFTFWSGRDLSFRHKWSRFGTLALTLSQWSFKNPLPWPPPPSVVVVFFVVLWRQEFTQRWEQKQKTRTYRKYNSFPATARLVCRLLYMAKYPIHSLGWNHVRISCVQMCVCVCVCACVRAVCVRMYNATLIIWLIILWLSNHFTLCINAYVN